MSRYRRKSVTDPMFNMRANKLASATSASVRIDIVSLAKWCEFAKRQDLGFLSVSQAVGSALDTLVYLLEQDGKISSGEIELMDAWNWLDEEDLIQQQMIKGRGKQLNKLAIFDKVRSEGKEDKYGLTEDDLSATFGKTFAQSNRAHIAFNPLEFDAQDISGQRAKVLADKEEKVDVDKLLKERMGLPVRSNPMQKTTHEFTAEQKDKFRAWFYELELEDKNKLAFNEDGGAYLSETYNKVWDPWSEEIQDEWSDRCRAFQLFITSAMHAWKMIEEMKPYTGEDGVINPPSTFFEEQAKTVAEHEQFLAEQEVKMREAAEALELEKEAKRKAKKLLKLQEEIAEAEKEHHAIVNKLRKDEALAVTD